MKNVDHAVVVGTGLIGASVALALRKCGVEVHLTDRDPGNVGQAVRLGAGLPLTASAPRADLVVIAVPPAAVAPVLHESQRAGLGLVYTDVASVKAPVIAAAVAHGCDLATFVPGHPMGGGEQSGPATARADLFLGRAWALCPTPAVPSAAVATVRAVATRVGAVPYELGAQEHDRAAALISHLPHLISSAVAARLLEADATALRLASAGVRDVTRVAAGDAAMWTDIIGRNAEPVADALDALVEDLRCAVADLRSATDSTQMPALSSLLRRGNEGRRQLLAAGPR